MQARQPSTIRTVAQGAYPHLSGRTGRAVVAAGGIDVRVIHDAASSTAYLVDMPGSRAGQSTEIGCTVIDRRGAPLTSCPAVRAAR